MKKLIFLYDKKIYRCCVIQNSEGKVFEMRVFESLFTFTFYYFTLMELMRFIRVISFSDLPNYYLSSFLWFGDSLPLKMSLSGVRQSLIFQETLGTNKVRLDAAHDM